MKITLSSDNLKSVLIGAGLAGAGAGLTYLSQYVTGIDFGVFGPLVAAALAVATNYVRKLSQEYQNPPEQS